MSKKKSDIVKEFSKPQKEELQQLIQQRDIAQASLNRFVNYLQKEHKIGDDYRLKKDLSGFEKVKNIEKKNKKK